MAIVNITGLATRKVATDKKSATPIHKSKPAPGKAYTKPPTVSQDKTYNSKNM
jgi:hypothetical protein